MAMLNNQMASSTLLEVSHGGLPFGDPRFSRDRDLWRASPSSSGGMPCGSIGWCWSEWIGMARCALKSWLVVLMGCCTLSHIVKLLSRCSILVRWCPVSVCVCVFVCVFLFCNIVAYCNIIWLSDGGAYVGMFNFSAPFSWDSSPNDLGFACDSWKDINWHIMNQLSSSGIEQALFGTMSAYP